MDTKKSERQFQVAEIHVHLSGSGMCMHLSSSWQWQHLQLLFATGCLWTVAATPPAVATRRQWQWYRVRFPWTTIAHSATSSLSGSWLPSWGASLTRTPAHSLWEPTPFLTWSAPPKITQSRLWNTRAPLHYSESGSDTNWTRHCCCRQSSLLSLESLPAQGWWVWMSDRRVLIMASCAPTPTPHHFIKTPLFFYMGWMKRFKGSLHKWSSICLNGFGWTMLHLYQCTYTCP